jgi:hypothetical protein
VGQADIHRQLGPIPPHPNELRIGPHRPSPGVSQIPLTLSLVDHPKRLRHQRLDKLTKQGVAVIAKERLRLPIDKTDHTRPIHTYESIWHGLQQNPEAHSPW